MSQALSSEPTTRVPARGLAGQLLWLIPFGVAIGPTLTWLLERWTLGIWYSGQQGLFVAAILAFLVWRDFQDSPPRLGQGSLWGLLLLVPGLASIALDSVAGTELWGAVGLILCLPGLSLLVLGAGRTRRLAFPLALSLFMLPIPGFLAGPVHLVLRHISANGAHALLPLLGVPVSLQGTTLLIPAGEVGVSDACSGFATLHSLATVALILAYLCPSPGRRLAILALTPMLALVTNTVRVSSLVLLVQITGFEVLDTWLHPASGMVAFAISLGALFAIGGRSALGAATTAPEPRAGSAQA